MDRRAGRPRIPATGPARRSVLAEPEVRAELAEDITARTAAKAVPVPLLERAPSRCRTTFGSGPRRRRSPSSRTSPAGSPRGLAARGASDAVSGRDAGADQLARAAAATGVEVDPAQVEAAAALAGDHSLVLVAGAAGAGKTTTLATTRTALEHDGHQVLAVTPTLKAARGARAETGARTGSAAWLVFQHGWRWDDAGRWTRLEPGQIDPKAGTTYRGPREDAQLRRGDLLVVDEAGMPDQDTARALLTVVDEQEARLALVGDPH